MPRNSLAGSTAGKSKSAKFFRNNPASKAKKDAYNTKYSASPERKAYRRALGKLNSKMGSVGDGKDVGHVTKTKAKLQSANSNRGDKKKFLFGKASKKKK
jgi:hypothetical protein